MKKQTSLKQLHPFQVPMDASKGESGLRENKYFRNKPKSTRETLRHCLHQGVSKRCRYLG
jgi:hypothetical protein